MTDGAFYAYLNVISNTTWAVTIRHSFVIVFASRAVADEWWRFVSAPVVAARNGDSTFLSRLSYFLSDTPTITRTTPQFYTCETSSPGMHINFLSNKLISAQFSGRMFLEKPEWLRLNQSFIPVQPIIDHISGKRFRIRAKQNPNLYWAFRDKNSIVDTSTTPSFHILVVELANIAEAPSFRIVGRDVPDGTILIGTDVIKIQVDDTNYVSREVKEINKENPFETPTWARLVWKNVGQPAEFKFSEFEEGGIMPDCDLRWELVR